MGREPGKRGLERLRAGSERIRARYSRGASRSLHLTGISGVGNLLLGLGKILSGALSGSVFACVNGCYTLGMVLARYCALAGALRGGEAECRCCRRAGHVLVGSSLLYVLWSAWSYFDPRETAYHPYIAMAIAAFTFTEIGLNLRGVLKNRRDRSLPLHAVKTINLAASLISLVLTQSALLSFADGGDHDPAVNALLGLLMGACAGLLGLYQLCHVSRAEARDRQERNDRNRRIPS